MAKFDAAIDISTVDAPHQSGVMTRPLTDLFTDISRGLIDGQVSEGVSGFSETITSGTEKLIWEGPTNLMPIWDAPQKLKIQAGGNAGDVDGGAGAHALIFIGIASDWATPLGEVVKTAGAAESLLTVNEFAALNRVAIAPVSLGGGVGTFRGANIGDMSIINEIDGNVIGFIKSGVGIARQFFFSVPSGFSFDNFESSPSVQSTQSVTLAINVHSNPNETAPPFTASLRPDVQPGVSGSVLRASRFSFPLLGPASIWLTAQSEAGMATVQGRANFLRRKL